jgi:hypothetical protein
MREPMRGIAGGREEGRRTWAGPVWAWGLAVGVLLMGAWLDSGPSAGDALAGLPGADVVEGPAVGPESPEGGPGVAPVVGRWHPQVPEVPSGISRTPPPTVPAGAIAARHFVHCGRDSFSGTAVPPPSSS